MCELWTRPERLLLATCAYEELVRAELNTTHLRSEWPQMLVRVKPTALPVSAPLSRNL